MANLDSRPPVEYPRSDPGFATPGYPQAMQGMSMDDKTMKAIWSRREVRGMRANYPMAVKGLMTVMRVLPDDLYRLVMEGDNKVDKGAVFAEIVRRFGDPAKYDAAPMMKMG